MNPPRVYTCSQSWTPLPPPSPYHPSGSSQCTSPEHPVSCIEPGLVIYFTYGNIHVSMLLLPEKTSEQSGRDQRWKGEHSSKMWASGWSVSYTCIILRVWLKSTQSGYIKSQAVTALCVQKSSSSSQRFRHYAGVRDKAWSSRHPEKQQKVFQGIWAPTVKSPLRWVLGLQG